MTITLPKLVRCFKGHTYRVVGVVDLYGVACYRVVRVRKDGSDICLLCVDQYGNEKRNPAYRATLEPIAGLTVVACRETGPAGRPPVGGPGPDLTPGGRPATLLRGPAPPGPPPLTPVHLDLSR